MSRFRARFHDPAGERYGLPSYPLGMAPPHLLTRRQLDAAGLRPGRQGAQAQALWRSRRHGTSGVRATYLYDVRLALPKRAVSGKSRAVRRRCPGCLNDPGNVLPCRRGDCAEGAV